MLALLGGKPVNTKEFEWKSSIDEQDNQAAIEVLNSKELSGFFGSLGPRFMGGDKVVEFDTTWADYFGSKHGVSVNSATSALYAAMGAIGIEPGDEVIVAPLSMAISATAPLVYGGIPVFADVEEDYFTLDPKSIEKQISDKTKAIIVVDLLGQAADLTPIMELAKKHDLKVIEDNAQAPGAMYQGKKVGTIADIGIFSLNCHKAVQTGEGGIAVTDDDELALRMQLIRNHGESVVEAMEYTNLSNMLGWNYRMTELQAVTGLVQLHKLEGVNSYKQEIAAYLDEKLKPFSFLQAPKIRPESTHVYYLYMIRYDSSVLGVSRDNFSKALRAEGFNASFGYVKPIYQLPMFQKRIAIGSKGWPFTEARKEVSYDMGTCPVAERLHSDGFFYPDLIRYNVTEKDLALFIEAIEKVATHAEKLK